MKKIKTIANIFASIAILTIVFTNKSQAATGKVTTETLNLRSEASTSSSVITLLNADDELEILSQEGNWYKVKFGDKQGYVSKDYVELNGSIEEPSNNTSTTSNITATNASTTNGTSNNTTASTTISATLNNNETSVTTAKIIQNTTIKILPLINSNSLDTINEGEEVTIISETNNWLFIETDTISGWILKTAITGEKIIQNTPSEKPTEQPQSQEPDEEDTPSQEVDTPKDETGTTSKEETSGDTTYSDSTTKYVNASSIYVRSEPSTSSEIVTTLIKNTDVIVTGENGDWYKVKFGSYTGYIYKELLSDTKQETTNRSSSEVNRTATAEQSNSTTIVQTINTTSKGEEIVAYAKQYLNCPYVYGASGPSTFDCSGFTMYVYKHFGINLSHSATAQSKCGTYVEKENLQPGDLVCFLDYETMDGIGHCGIYIGDGNFIHASSGTGYCVKISKLTSGSYLTRYSTARRLL